MHQFLQLLPSFQQRNTSRILTGDTSGVPSEVNVVQAICQVTKSIIGCVKIYPGGSEATHEASTSVHSESVEELSDTPDHPLSASDTLSPFATMS